MFDSKHELDCQEVAAVSPDLKYLSLKDVKIKNIESLPVENLKDLSLENCGLKKIPKVLRKAGKLRTLLLSKNPLEAGFENIPDIKQDFETSQIYLKNCGLEKIPSTIKNKFRKLNSNDYFYIYLGENPITDEIDIPRVDNFRISTNSNSPTYTYDDSAQIENGKIIRQPREIDGRSTSDQYYYE